MYPRNSCVFKKDNFLKYVFSLIRLQNKCTLCDTREGAHTTFSPQGPSESIKVGCICFIFVLKWVLGSTCLSFLCSSCTKIKKRSAAFAHFILLGEKEQKQWNLLIPALLVTAYTIEQATGWKMLEVKKKKKGKESCLEKKEGVE